MLHTGYVGGLAELQLEKVKARRGRGGSSGDSAHDPAAYLAKLEQQCLQLTLPP